MSKIADIKKALKDMESTLGMEVGVVMTRNGIPMAWNSPDGTDIETFATLSATIFGASEVIFSGNGRGAPEIVLVHAPDGTFVAAGLGRKGVLSGFSRGVDDATLRDGIKAAAQAMAGVL